MEKSMFFWLVMFLILIIGAWAYYPVERRPIAGPFTLLYIAVGILGWIVCGNAVK